MGAGETLALLMSAVARLYTVTVLHLLDMEHGFCFMDKMFDSIEPMEYNIVHPSC